MKEHLESTGWLYNDSTKVYYKQINKERYRLWNHLGRIGITDDYGNTYCIYPCKTIDEFNKIIEDIMPFINKTQQ